MATSQRVPGTQTHWDPVDINQLAGAVVELQGVANGGSLAAKTADYLIIPLAGGGCQAINGSLGTVDFSTTSTTDHRPVFQSCVDALNPNIAGLGGTIAFKGQFVFNTQLILGPNIALVGVGGPNGYNPSGALYYGNVIKTTFNGSTILITGGTGVTSTFTVIENLTLAGNASFTSQNGIEWDSSAGDLRDTFLMGVLVFHMGQHGFVIGGTNAKIFANQCFAEFNGGAGIKDNGNGTHLWWINGYMTGNVGACYDGSGSAGLNVVTLMGEFLGSGTGIIPAIGATGFRVLGAEISSNTGPAIDLPTGGQIGPCVVSACSMVGNGSAAIPTIRGANGSNTSSRLNVTGCTIRGSSNTNNVVLAASGQLNAVFSGNTFFGASGDAILWTSRTGNKLILKDNLGYNDVKGKITNPFHTGQLRIGAAGSAAAPTASTTYTVEGTDLMLAITAGTGVSITITDVLGNTVTSGLTTYTGLLKIGYAINFGAFSVAPTVYVGVA